MTGSLSKKETYFLFFLNSNDELLVKNESMSIADLKESAVEFITNFGVKDHLSESPGKAVVSLKNDPGTSYNMYVQVQNEIRAAYNEIWNHASQQKIWEIIRRFEY